MTEKTCIIISGPTAVGKTTYGIELAQKYHTQIISADSRQCFKELNIGVAKPSEKQLEIVKHYFINSHSIHEEVNSKIFEEYALKQVNKIFEDNDIAIMVGGTGLYIKAFCEGLDEIPAVDAKIRKEINEQFSKNGLSWLRHEIEMHDALFFLKGEMQNPQRMLRALEVKLSTGKSILDFHSRKKVNRNFTIKNIVLELPREQLYSNISYRVDEMMKEGLLQEAENLFQYRHLNALQTVGYKELFNYMEGKISLTGAIEEIKKNTRHFAKRQITWFKKAISTSTTGDP
ncbi:MAG: tRNA (adenosine(37)-N6)-dimethylallyltransferase MiaA [Bacteroidota bacterium]|nr:tRNA (adenosine(37)-N6)-dimethylallyltransferase MiaA [Bacteroidota bacterium]